MSRPKAIEWNGIARHAYEAYAESRLWRDYRGSPLPQWVDVDEKIQLAWVAAAKAVAERV